MIMLLLNHTMYIQVNTIWTSLIYTVAFRNKGFSMIAPFIGQDLLVGPHRGYEPIDDWNKLRNNKGEGLLIGDSFTNHNSMNQSFMNQGSITCSTTYL
jgi:hypothetical protein